MKILISAGPTREYLDPVRFISNPSTGKMGYLIAEECMKKGHEVTLVSGPTHLKPPTGVKLIHVETASEMEREIINEFPKASILIMTAAVSDWRPLKRAPNKIKRKNEWSLKLVPNPDILKAVGEMKTGDQRVIGFALETSDIIKNAKKKLKDKKLDLIIANTPDFFRPEKKTSKVVFIYRSGRVENFKRMTREQTARKLATLLTRIKPLRIPMTDNEGNDRGDKIPREKRKVKLSKLYGSRNEE